MTIDQIRNDSSFDDTEMDDNALEEDFVLIDGLLFDNGKRSFLGFDSCKTNVLAIRDDFVVRALCYDAK